MGRVPEYLNRHLSKEDVHKATRHMKRCPTPLIVIKMQTKTTSRVLKKEKKISIYVIIRMSASPPPTTSSDRITSYHKD